jgi:hypothetical protein
MRLPNTTAIASDHNCSAAIGPRMLAVMVTTVCVRGAVAQPLPPPVPTTASTSEPAQPRFILGGTVGLWVGADSDIGNVSPGLRLFGTYRVGDTVSFVGAADLIIPITAEDFLENIYYYVFSAGARADLSTGPQRWFGELTLGSHWLNFDREGVNFVANGLGVGLGIGFTSTSDRKTITGGANLVLGQIQTSAQEIDLRFLMVYAGVGWH